MRRRLHTVLVYFGFLEDRTAAAAPPRPFRERFLEYFVFVGGLMSILSAIQGAFATAVVLAVCVLLVVAAATIIRRRRRDRD